MLVFTQTPSHTDTVHGSQPYIPQRHVPPPNYHTYQLDPIPDTRIPAEDYQNLWDPWEEYDMRQSQNHLNWSEIIPIVSHTHSYQNQEQQESYNQIFQSPIQPSDNRDHWVQDYNKPSETHNESNSHSQSFNIPESHSHIQYETESHYIENNRQNQLVESHNTNAYLAGHHDNQDYQHSSDSHNSHPPPPTYSQPQYHPVTLSQPQYHPITNIQPQYHPITHSQPQYHPIIEPIHESVIHHEPTPPEKALHKPPPVEIPCPRLPDECVATSVVSNDISLNTGTNEDSNDNSVSIFI